MKGTLSRGSRVRLAHGGGDAIVGDLLGSGGQGEVYRVDVNGEGYALKWYLPGMVPAHQRDAIGYLIERGAPSDRFLWPIDLADASSGPCFGYVMPLRPDGYATFADLLSGRVDATFSALTRSGFEFADSFLRLHSLGFCYRDISYTNAFFEPTSGQILICDNDNVGIDGVSVSNVKGTVLFMAPEVVRGEQLPSRSTDLHSLAVLLFYLLVFHNPFEGSMENLFQGFDQQAQAYIFGAHPVFIFDPDDHSNAPDPDWHPNPLIYWPLLPRFIRRLFETAFGPGLHDPDQRVTESQWRKAMVQLSDSVVHCAACNKQNFHDDEPAACWNCGQTIVVPPVLDLNGFRILLNRSTQVFSYHVEVDYDRRDVVAEVVQHPTDPKLWGIKNRSAVAWQVRDKDGNERTVEPDHSVSLMGGVVIDFGPARGTIRTA
jgi:serine/threonine protein kinase